MAIDTRAKRASALGVGRPWMRGKNPDATKGQEWRITTGNAYGGNALSSAIGDIFTATGHIKQKVSASPSTLQRKPSTQFIKQVVTETVER